MSLSQYEKCANENCPKTILKGSVLMGYCLECWIRHQASDVYMTQVCCDVCKRLCVDPSTSIACSSCPKCIHPHCYGISNDMFKTYKESSNLRFSCNSCQKSPPSSSSYREHLNETNTTNMVGYYRGRVVDSSASGKLMQKQDTPPSQADPAPGTTIREAKILEISQRLDVLRGDLDSLRQNPSSQAGNRIHSTPMNSVPHNIPPPSFTITNASPFPLQSNNVTNHHRHLRNTSPNVTNIRHEALTTDDIDEIQRKFQEANSVVAGVRAGERLGNSGDHRRISPRRTPRSSYSPSTNTPTSARSPGKESDFRRNLFSSPGDRRRSRDSSIRLSLHGDIATINTSDEQFDDSNASHLHVENEVESRAGKGFTILEDTSSPALEIEKKKEKFFQNRLRKEKEQREQQMKRELEALERKQKAREKEEESARKKQQKEEKRKRLLNQHKKILEDQEQISLAYKRPGVVPTGGMKRTTKSKSTTNLVNAHSSFKSLASLESESPFSISSSSKHHHHTPRSMVSGRSERNLSDLDSVVSAPTSEYTGPKLYKQLQSKSNKALIKNGITFSCLPGKVNESSRRKVLNALDKVELAGHFMILFRDHKLQYRAVYDFDVECEKLHRITGTGPTVITPLMVEDLYKYNSGKRTFSKILSKTMSMSIDAVTIKNHLWQHPSKR